MLEQRVFVVGRWLLALFLCASASPAFALAPKPPAQLTDTELSGLLQKFRKLKEAPDFEEEWRFKRLGLEDPHRVIVSAALERPEPQHAIAKLRKRYALNETAARDLLSGQLLAFPAGGFVFDVEPEQLQRALDLYLEAAREAPGNPAVLAAMLTLPGTYKLPAGERETRFLEALNASPDPVETALQLSRLGGGLDDWNVSLAAYAVSRQLDALPRSLEALGFRERGREATLFYFAAYQALRSRQQGTLPAELIERLLRDLLDEELPSLAVEVLHQLPATQRDNLLAGKWTVQDARITSRLNGESEEMTAPGDLRPGLSAALLIGGAPQEAKPWLEAAAPVSAEGNARDESCVPALQRAILTFHLKPEPEADPFQLLVLEQSCQRGLPYPWSVLLAQQLQTRYSKSAREFLGWAVGSAREDSRTKQPPLHAQLSFLTQARATLEAEDKARLTRLESALAAIPEQASDVQPTAQPDPLASRIRELLAAPPASPFTEHPLSEAPKPKAAARWSPIKEGLKPPEGFRPVRAERSGKRVLLLALSQRLDPVGEVSGGGYWLLESQNGGQTWSSILYTGLRQYRPYELATKSSLPMLEGDTLRLEASVRELEEKSITFPPIGLRTKREKKGLFLQASLAELRNDTDADGLPDLVEERLLTDPNVADSDADGLSDEEDPLPQVPAARRGTESPGAQLLPAFLAWLNTGETIPKGLEVGLPDEGDSQNVLRLPKGTTPESRYDATFLEMDRGLLRGVRMPSRTLVLSSEELKTAQERFGRFYPLSIQFLFNTRGDTALIEWNEHWRGGSYVARKKDGQWEFESLSSWIT
ncbi:hypothetical protein [Vitiosangium sp. GDMCC 1.1324]|uniref:hypothetical protein n=1 Tax=Vitiosangium sp. (strain GDMCC 1.1324) TaxID=2138576 RepID=UPI000D3635AB|nr:hypothetical protein [Vitiosangium sp. GDMCC 1.1324]PTL81325.1 hypothetical protein DAT35_24755 [Vitiosangium sp. GDMCC 1.1324]